MTSLKIYVLGSAAALAVITGIQAADLPKQTSVPIESLRVCSTYGAGFFYIPGTETCLRLSGRARFEFGYQAPLARSGAAGDYSSYRGLARINLDARTQTDYGALRAFIRIEAASRTGPYMFSNAQLRIGNAFAGTGADSVGRVQQYINTDKAFIQFAGLTAGRASSFFDFYAHDLEILAVTLGSDLPWTNLAAYTAALGNGFSATVSMEDPNFRRTPTFSAQPTGVPLASTTVPLTPFFAGYTNGQPSGVAFLDLAQRSRMPDFVGVMRYDRSWGSAQLSTAVREINTGNPDALAAIGTHAGMPLSAVNAANVGRAPSEYGWAVQGGVKVNMPFIAEGDTFYLQGAYARGAQMYTGYSVWAGAYNQTATSIQGAPFTQFFSDAVLNPLTNRLELSTSFTFVASFLHYWNPSLRSAVFGSYGEISFAPGARAAQAFYANLTGNGPGALGSTYYRFSQILRDGYQYNVGASLIWSPVKDLDIGVEGTYLRYGVQSGRVLDLNKNPLQTSAAYVNTPANLGALRTVNSADIFQVRGRVQRDF